jgi:hypothetical protein
VLLPANPDMGVARSSAIVTRIAATVFMAASLRSSAGWISVGHHLHPSARAGFNVGVVALGVLTVVPIIGFRLILLNIPLGLLFDNNRWRWIVRVVWIIGVGPRTPPSGSPAWADKDTGAVRISMPVVPAVPIITTRPVIATIPTVAAIPAITTRPLIAAGPAIATRPLAAAGPARAAHSSRVRWHNAYRKQRQ